MSFNNKIYLASSSPRRRQLISYLFSNIKTIYPNHTEPKEKNKEAAGLYLERCLDAKWSSAVGSLTDRPLDSGDLLLVADTIVVCQGQILQKPIDRMDAKRLLGRLSDREHFVFTGVRLGVWGGPSWRHLEIHEKSQVVFRRISVQEIDQYIKTGEPMDKAGAYGFQGRGLQFVDRVRGSYSNIMGLPVEALKQTVQKLLSV